MIKTVEVLPGQNLSKIALQELGSVEGIFKILELNGGGSLTDNNLNNLQIDTESVIKREVVAVFVNYGIKPGVLKRTLVEKGIGYWTIGVDFIIN